MDIYYELIVNNLSELDEFAKKIVSEIKKGCIVGLTGGLGAGKTQFTKFFVKHLGGEIDEVVSPTFTILNEYEVNSGIVYHFDLYRLSSMEELEDIGYEEFFFSEATVLIEWVNIIPDLMKMIKMQIDFEVIDNTRRKITVKKITEA